MRNPFVTRQLNKDVYILDRQPYLFCGQVDGSTTIYVGNSIYTGSFHNEISTDVLGVTVTFVDLSGTSFHVYLDRRYVIDNHVVSGISTVSFSGPVACTIFMKSKSGTSIPRYEKVGPIKCRRASTASSPSFGIVGESSIGSCIIYYVDNVITVDDFVCFSDNVIYRVREINKWEDKFHRVQLISARLETVPWEELK